MHRNLLFPLSAKLTLADSLLLSHHAREIFQTLSARIARKNVVDCDAVRSDFIRERACETRNCGTQTVRQQQAIDRLFHRDRRDVENASPVSRFHSRQNFAREMHGAVKRELRRLFPLFVRQLIETAGRWTTGVRHENVDLPEAFVPRGDEMFDLHHVGYVSGHTEDAGAGLISDSGGGFRERRGVARADDHGGAFSSEFFRDGAAESATARYN